MRFNKWIFFFYVILFIAYDFWITLICIILSQLILSKSNMAAAQMSNDKLLPYLHQILKTITINEETAKENVRIMIETVDSIVTAMKGEDLLFYNLFQKKVYTGSYFEGLRITEPDEFDLNLILSLPFKPQDLEIIPSPNHPAFAKYCLRQTVPALLSNHPKWNVYRQLERHFDSARCLRRDTLQQWLEGVVTKASKSSRFCLPSSVKEVNFRKSGPAFTMLIKKNNGKVIDVDLVPCIEGPTTNWPKGVANSPRISQLTPTQRAWFLIPKTYKDPNGQVAQSDPALWRIAMPEAEKALIHNIGCVKVLIKLFKRLRDKQNWKSIASYYIKTLINLAIDEHPAKDYWHAKNMGKLFMEMLKKLRDTVQERKLPHFFYRNANLLAQLSPLEASNIVGRINTIIKDIEKNPGNVLQFF